MPPQKRLVESMLLPQPLPVLENADQHVACHDALPPLRQMARGLVHDFNNALSPVLGYAELLLEDLQLTGKQRQSLERIEAGAMRAVEILRRLDLFYRDTHNHGLSTVAVAALIRDIVELDFLASSPKGASPLSSCRLELDESLEIEADPAELRVLLTQLFKNALEASVDAQAAIVVHWARQGDDAILEMTDNGVGMSPELCQVCREPFRTTKSAVGTGLGLSMCHGIVRRLSGSMKIDSAVGRGTTVRITFPI